MTADVLELACQLVSIPSVNPMGRQLPPALAGEQRVTDWLERFFQAQQLPYRRYEVRRDAGGLVRENIVARIDGQPTLAEGGRCVLLEAHQDTVPVDGMTIEPFAAHVQHGCLYGRGACDIKGGLACILSAARQAQQWPQRPTIILACTVNEEFGFCGAKQLAALLQAGGDEILPRIPDAIVVTEPTELNVVCCHKGMVRWVCTTQGRAAHSSDPTTGDNAIYRMAAVVTRLAEYADQLAARGSDAQVGPPSLNVGTIQGGISVNTVPDVCQIEIDRRLLPSEDPESARQAVIDFLITRGCQEFVQHEPPFITSPGLTADANQELAQRLVGAANQTSSSRTIGGAAYGTNAAFLAATGAPTVVFGPGSIEQAHTADEWVAVEQLQLARASLLYFLQQFSLTREHRQRICLNQEARFSVRTAL